MNLVPDRTGGSGILKLICAIVVALCPLIVAAVESIGRLTGEGDGDTDPPSGGTA